MSSPFPRPEQYLAEGWTFFVFLLCLILIAWTHISEPGQARKMWGNSFNIRLMRQEMREESQNRNTRWVYTLVFSLMLSLLIYFTAREALSQNLRVHSLLIFLVIVVSVNALYLIRHLLLRAVMVVADGDFSLSEYGHSTFLISRILGLVLFPLLILASYLDLDISSILLFASWIVFGLGELYRWGRGVWNGLSSGVPLFYIFFYLCTLEFLPLAVGARLILS